MALALFDRVQQTGTANTTVSFTLSGSVVGYQSFAVIGNGNTTYYAATDVSGNWEVGIGTYSTTGPTLTRTTILSSSNSGSAVTFSGTVNVFVTYPSERSVNLDGSGNVSALGTITSGVWNGTTIPVAYGGTGVTASSGANSVMLRDANQNVSINRLNQSSTTVTAAGGTTILTAASTFSQILVGTGGQTFKLPDATTLTNTTTFEFNNNATGTLTIVDNASGAVGTIASGGAAAIALLSNGTVGGTWDVHAYIPENVTWGTNALALGSTVITGGTWNGGTIQPGYGGTGLTTFSAANNALYSTSSSALTAGTLPVLAGGTGVTTSTGTGSVVLSNSPTLVTPALGTPSSATLTNATGLPLSTGVTGTLPIANGGTGQTTASAAFNALSPITSTGDLILGNGTNSATRLAIGSSGYVLTSNGTTASWTAPATGGGTITVTDFTATAGQTTFTVNYTVGAVEVYQNGAKLAIADYTATTGTSIVLATGAAAGDLIEVVTFSTLNLYSTITYDVFSGTGSQTVYTMTAVPANSASLLVAISGVVQDPGTYTVSSTTLTFTTAPPAGTGNISVRYLGVASVGTVGSFSAGTTGLTPSSATTGAVVLGGTLNVANGGTGQTSFTAGQIHYGSFSTSSNLYFDGTNLGIGTSSPAQTLHVKTSTASTPITLGALSNATSIPALSFNGAYASTTMAGTYQTGTNLYNTVPATGYHYWSVADVNKMTLDTNGNLGIGTTSPAVPLDVVSNSGASGITQRGRSSDNIGTMRWSSNDGATTYGQIQGRSTDFRVNAFSNIPLIFYTNDTERMRIDSSGNVQLSTASTSLLNSSGRKILNQTGGILQVVSTTKTDTFSTTSASYTAVTGLSVTITPSSTSSKILVTGAIALAPPSGASSSIQLQRSGTVIDQGDASGSQPRGFAAVEGSLYSSTSEALNYLDSPGTTSAITYQIYMQVSGGTGYINRTYNNRSSTAYDAVTASTITVMEIAQ